MNELEASRNGYAIWEIDTNSGIKVKKRCASGTKTLLETKQLAHFL